MNRLKNIITQHKMASLIALFLLVIFVGGSAVSAINVAKQREQTTETSMGQESPKEDISDTLSGESPDETNDTMLTDSQKAAIAEYDDDTLALIETLSASVWSSSDGRSTLRFADITYTETVSGKATTHPYAILHADKESDDIGGSLYTIVFETDTGTHVVKYADGKGAASSSGTQGATVVSTLSSASMFTLKDTPYKRADAVENITIKGLNSAATQLLGEDADKLTSQLSSWCAVHYPTVSEATWSGTVFIDYNNSLVTTDFKLDGESNVTLSAIYHTDSGTFEFDG